jgi:hypothetical protein
MAGWPTQEVMSEMTAARRRSHRNQRRFWRNCRRVFVRAVRWAILTYAFVRVYLYLYGAHPAVVPRVGTTLAALCAIGAGLSAGFGIISWVVEWLTGMWQRWVPRLGGSR